LLKSKFRNIDLPYVSKGWIPLGTYNDRPVFKILPRISDTIVIVAKPGRGKSVIMRNIYYFISLVRPIVVFDWEGEDHKLSHYANSRPINLAPGMQPSPVRNSTFFAYGKERESFEREIKPNLSSYDVDELEAVGFSPSAALELRRLMRKYRPFKDVYDLIDFVRLFPGNVSDAGKMRMAKKRNKYPHRAFKHYIEGDTLHPASKQSMVKTLEHLADRDYFRMDDKRDPDIIPLLEARRNLFFNFQGDVGLARVEIIKKTKQILNYRKKFPRGVKPYIFYEEVDALFPRIANEQEKHLVDTGVRLILRGRKTGLGQCYCAPSFWGLHPKIPTACNEKIFGQMEGKDIDALQDLTRSEYLVSRVRSLPFNRYTNERMFVYVDEFGKIRDFSPYECPNEIHREN